MPEGSAFAGGARLIGVTAVGTFCWGAVTGLALVKGGLSAAQALGMVALVYSGTAQLAALPLIAAGASVAAVCAAALLANLRFVVYSAVVAGEFRGRPLPERLLLGWMTTDTGLAVYLAGQRHADAPAAVGARAARFLGANATVFAAWTAGAALGVLLSAWVPDSPQLAFVGVLAILALVGPMLVSRVTVTAALVAAAVALLGRAWPWHLGTYAAIAAGVAAALWATPAAERAAGRGTARGPAAAGGRER